MCVLRSNAQDVRLSMCIMVLVCELVVYVIDSVLFVIEYDVVVDCCV